MVIVIDDNENDDDDDGDDDDGDDDWHIGHNGTIWGHMRPYEAI